MLMVGVDFMCSIIRTKNYLKPPPPPQRLTVIYGCSYLFIVLLLYLSIISFLFYEYVAETMLSWSDSSCRYTLVPASWYLGFCASIIWVGEGIYLTSTARSHATDNKLDEGAVIGDFNGEFWAVFALHQFIGNLITFALLNDGKKPSTRERRILLLLEASYFAPIFYWWTSLYVQ
ncbi:UNC93-like protein 3 isoform X2 [Lotus japonicus]|uniref:UNC93-like protein 3 isoform X2 n=1 Tax=Lotus japonicus TaxID=34305 RepID=UPI002586831A|nr:UNC93-like protein 3 isoform X2 [Lotus japonicus]